MAGVDDDGQVAELFDRRDRREVEGVAGVGLEGADAPLAEDDVLVAARHDVFGAHQPFLDRGGKAALEEDGLVGVAELLEQLEVLHVARAHLDDVHVLREELDVVGGHDLGHDRKSRLGAGLLEQPQAVVLESLERIGGGAGLERAAAQEIRAHLLNLLRDAADLLLALDRAGPRHHRDLFAADLAAPRLHDGRVGMEHAVGLFERLGDVHDALDVAVCLDPSRVDLARVAHEAEDDQVLADDRVDLHAPAGERVGELVDLLLRGSGSHNDDHCGCLQ